MCLSILFQDETHVDFCTLRRLREAKKFIVVNDFGLVSYKINDYDRRYKTTLKDILDIGDRNYIGEELAKTFCFKYDNTLPCNFNYSLETPKERYDTIMCWETFEHVPNALTFLENMGAKLTIGGILYVSVPLAHPFGFMFNVENHYHEPHKHVLDKVFDYVGFEILSYKEFKTIPFWRGMYEGGGLFRTFFRVYFQKTGLWRLRKK